MSGLFFGSQVYKDTLCQSCHERSRHTEGILIGDSDVYLAYQCNRCKTVNADYDSGLLCNIYSKLDQTLDKLNSVLDKVEGDE